VGQIVVKQSGNTIIANAGLININATAQGIYFLQIKRNGEVGMKKLVK
jgi:hypothetical protein